MATEKTRAGQEVSRRGFIAACGAATAVAAIPKAALAAATGASWPPDLNAFRAAYAAFIERRATELRPKFESGELRGATMTGPDKPDDDPFYALHEQIEAEIPDAPAAYLILACSPAEATGIEDTTLSDARSAAAECIMVDVFRVARSRGWWKPAPDEYMGHDEWEVLSEIDWDAQEARS